MISEEHRINSLRKEIDNIDEMIIKHLNNRAKLSLEIRDLKSQANLPVFDPQREQEILTKISLVNEGPLNEQSVKEIYSKILVCMKNFE